MVRFRAKKLSILCICLLVLLMLPAVAVGEGEPQLVKLTGTAFGTPPTSTNVYPNAFDGKINTAFGGERGGYCGLDLGEGSSKVVKMIKYHPRLDSNDFLLRFVGAQIQGANGDAEIDANGNFSEELEWKTLYTITNTLDAFRWTEVPLENETSYRYLRIIFSSTYHATIAELEFWGIAQEKEPPAKEIVKFTGTPFGTPPTSTNTYPNAFDGKLDTAFGGDLGGYCGLDLGADSNVVLKKFRYHPRLNSDHFLLRFEGAQIQGANGDAQIDANGNFSERMEWTTLYTITDILELFKWTDVEIENETSYRYLRMIFSSSYNATVAELEFWGFTEEDPDPPEPGIKKLTAGTEFGTPPYSTNTYPYAFDGSLSTAFGGNLNGYCGLDFGAETDAVVKKVKFYPRNPGNYADRLVGAQIQGANGDAVIDVDGGFSEELDWVTLYTITQQPEVVWTQVELENETSYRYVRMIFAENQYAAVAELEFWGTMTDPPPKSLKIEGDIFGTISNSAEYYTYAFDQDVYTGFEGEAGGYCGIDLGAGAEAVVRQVKLHPSKDGLYLNRVSDSLIQGANGNAQIDEYGNFSEELEWVTLATVPEDIEVGWTTLDFKNDTTYRYLRYYSPERYVSIGELEFYEAEATPDVIQKGELLYTAACISDCHIDAGIQNQAVPLRQGIIKTCEEIQAHENANVMLIGGDTTSDHIGTAGKYDLTIFNKVKGALQQTLGSAARYDRVLYANGNHEYAAGLTRFNSGYYEDVMMEHVGPYEDAYYLDVAKQYLLAYHYKIDGANFVVINTPNVGQENHGPYPLTTGTIDWVANKLRSIPHDEIVFVLQHYPLRDSRGISKPDKGVASAHNESFKQALLNHPNVVNLYGHDHGASGNYGAPGSTEPYIYDDTFERVTPYRDNGTVIQARDVKPTGFVSSFMGSMAYYGGMLSGLSAAQPKIVQALMVYVYDNCVELQMKNYGELNPGGEVLTSYIFERSFSKDKLLYHRDDEAGTIEVFQKDATALDVMRLLDMPEVTLFDRDGYPMGDMDSHVTNGTKLVDRDKGYTLLAGKRTDHPYLITQMDIKKDERSLLRPEPGGMIQSVSIRQTATPRSNAMVIVALYDENKKTMLAMQPVPLTEVKKYTTDLIIEGGDGEKYIAKAFLWDMPAVMPLSPSYTTIR